MAHALIYLLGPRRKWPQDRNLWRHAALLGVFGTAVPMTSIVSSLQFQSAGLTAILLTIGPAITVVMAHFWLQDEKLNPRKVIGVVLAFGGAVLLAVLRENGLSEVEASPIGYGLVILAMFFGSGAAVYIRRNLRSFDAFDLASVRMLFAALAVLLISVFLVGIDLRAVNGQGYLALGYASLSGTFLGLLLALYIAQKFGATAVSITSYVIPVVAAVGGLLVLDEEITAGMLAGMGLILAGIAVINRWPRRGIPHVQG
jgi:drug/metabolite transporter (DMT)-like permease